MSIVITNLIGGLGNQMFQYAAGRALSLRNGAKLKLDISGFRGYPLRRYELDALSIQATVAEIANEPGISTHWSRWYARLNRWTGTRQAMTESVPIYAEPHYKYDPAFMSITAPVHLTGYWQSERYFKEFADVIRRDFVPKAPLDDSNAAVARLIEASNSVALHVRRGDYVTNPVAKNYHGTCTQDYYLRAIEFVKAKVANLQLFVFSDENEWVRDNMNFGVPTVHVTVNAADSGYRDMYLMARCKHQILANSSFSWWGGWLNPSSEKIVVAPRNWFNGAVHDTSDLLPPSWIRL